MSLYLLMVVVFVLGYLAIALEHKIHIDKAASALVTGMVCWALYVFGMEQIVDINSIPAHVMQALNPSGTESAHNVILHYVTEHQILEHLAEIANILFFLIGAMTIVELIEVNGGFELLTSKIKTTKKVQLLWIVSLLTFFLSAVLDNLTTTIVMVSLLRKLIADKQERWFFAGMVVIAANAGGAWSPIGDVTTTMLWIGKQISAMNIIKILIIPSLAAMLAPLIIASMRMKGGVLVRPEKDEELRHHAHKTGDFEKKLIFFVGIAGLLFVPVFKMVTHLQPFMGMMLSLGVMWVMTDILNRNKSAEAKMQLGVIGVLRRIDKASVLFFLGILLAVASMQSAGQLREMAGALDATFDTTAKTGIYSIGMIIGLLSAVVDNVPLVAAAMGMYDVVPGTFFMEDGLFWEYLAFCAGTGGSALIIGSAAGVAAMGIEKIDFVWYLKRMSLLALVGYFVGIGVYILQHLI